jgi:hypothetical protein
MRILTNIRVPTFVSSAECPTHLDDEKAFHVASSRKHSSSFNFAVTENRLHSLFLNCQRHWQRFCQLHECSPRLHASLAQVLVDILHDTEEPGARQWKPLRETHISSPEDKIGPSIS